MISSLDTVYGMIFLSEYGMNTLFHRATCREPTLICIHAVDSSVAGNRTASLWCNTEFEEMARAINLAAQETHGLRDIAKAIIDRQSGDDALVLHDLFTFLPSLLNHQVLLLGIEAIFPD